MKKTVVISIAIFVLLLTIAFAQQEPIPIPFAKAAQLALKCGLDPSGRFYMWKTEVVQDGEHIIYQINYWKDDISLNDQVVLIKYVNMSPQSIAYIIPVKKFMKFTPRDWWTEITKENGLKLAFYFFRELVEKNLI